MAELVAPVDPRQGRGPAFGELPRTSRLEELVVRVLAPNPGLMALDGTNTYVVAAPGSAHAAIVDPCPPDAKHLAEVEAALDGVAVRWIIVTHHHIDHYDAAQPWATWLGAP